MGTTINNTGVVLPNGSTIKSSTPNLILNDVTIKHVLGRSFASANTATSVTTPFDTWLDNINYLTYTRVRNNSNILVIARISVSWALASSGASYSSNDARLKFVNSSTGTTYSSSSRGWCRYDKNLIGAVVEHEETVSVLFSETANTSFGTAGTTTQIIAQYNCNQSSGTVSRFGINLWGPGSSVQVIEYI